MFSEFACDFDTGDETTKIFVRRNGSDAPLKELRLPPNSKLSALFEKAAKVLDMDGPTLAFFSNGVECTDLEHVEDDEVIYISQGEPFKAAVGGHGTGSQVVGNYLIHEQLGQGGFGSVMKGVHSETGEVAAIKFVSKASFKQIADLQRVFQEIQALRNLHHPNVVRILDVADNPENVCFIMEFCQGGELRAYVERHCMLEEDETKGFFKQIVRAIHYCHTKKIIHRDLKLENILLDGQNRCKIVDFGLSDYVSSKERTVTDAGTEAYLAPEVYNGTCGETDPYKIDVWGLGVILYAMAHGRLPFSRPDVETCQQLTANGPQYREELSREYRRLCTAMLIPSAAKRYTMDEVTLDPWITSNRFADLQVDAGDDEEEAEGDVSQLTGEEDAVTAIFMAGDTEAPKSYQASAVDHMHSTGSHSCKNKGLVVAFQEPGEQARPPQPRSAHSPPASSPSVGSDTVKRPTHKGNASTRTPSGRGGERGAVRRAPSTGKDAGGRA